jgi:redox-sensitive bicupin YhaK (pirin superfamily)
MSMAARLTGQDKDLGGGFTVRRLLPSAARQSIGPFVFFDHFGPVTVEPGVRHDVRPHPHIGLATVTYLFEGAIMHRDSLGITQRIEPGAINWMTAGRGIVHSERGPEDLRETAYVNHGLQLWAALPRAFEETPPAFTHTPAADIPESSQPGANVRILVGTAFGKTSPVLTFAPTVYLDVALDADANFELPPLADELAIYAVEGELLVNGEALAAHTLAILAPGETVRVSSAATARFAVIGGDALDGPRTIWWNFVSSRKDRIAEAARAWEQQTIGQVPGDDEFIPLPERRFPGT